MSAELIREMANEEPAVTDPAKRPRIVIAPTAVGFGLSRMFQIVGSLNGRYWRLSAPWTRRWQHSTFNPHNSSP